MHFPNDTQPSSSTNSSSQIPLNTLAFIGAILFFIGSGISVYIAYQNLKS